MTITRLPILAYVCQWCSVLVWVKIFVTCIIGRITLNDETYEDKDDTNQLTSDVSSWIHCLVQVVFFLSNDASILAVVSALKAIIRHVNYSTYEKQHNKLGQTLHVLRYYCLWAFFSARQHIFYSALYAIARPSVCPSVTRVDQSKTVEVIGSCNLHHRVAPWL